MAKANGIANLAYLHGYAYGVRSVLRKIPRPAPVENPEPTWATYYDRGYRDGAVDAAKNPRDPEHRERMEGVLKDAGLA